MREVVEKFNVYGINELSKEAKERAFQDWCNDDCYPYSDYNRTVLDKFAEVFGIVDLDWEYGYRNYIRFSTTNEYSEELTGVRLMKYIWNNYKQYLYTMKIYYKNGIGASTKTHCSKISYITGNCPLTGYFIDNDIIQPIHEFMNNPRKDINYYDLMKKCLYAWISACNDDYNSYYSMETFIDEAEMNEWEYYENGKQY
jgi:hypothetical protein